MSSFRYLDDKILPSTADCILIIIFVLAIGRVVGGLVTVILLLASGWHRKVG